jgi:hypothetical protein
MDHPVRTQMPETIKAGTILIKDGTFLPDALRFETEPCAPGWRLVKNLDGYGLGRKIHEAGWTFFCLAGEIKAIVLGIDEQRTVRRAVKRILARLKREKFNSLEITQMANKRLLGVPYASVCARSRHIQESVFLFQAKDLRVRDRGDWLPLEPRHRAGTSTERLRAEDTIIQLDLRAMSIR